MSTSIWKFPIRVDDEIVIDMPRSARILHVGVQNGQPHIWAMVDTKAPMVDHHFAMRGTGHPAEGLEGLLFVGTFMMASGALVFHLFDRGEL